MNEWHVMTDDGWLRVQSDIRPYGVQVHRLTGNCLNEPCGKIRVPKHPIR